MRPQGPRSPPGLALLAARIHSGQNGSAGGNLERGVGQARLSHPSDVNPHEERRARTLLTEPARTDAHAARRRGDNYGSPLRL